MHPTFDRLMAVLLLSAALVSFGAAFLIDQPLLAVGAVLFLLTAVLVGIDAR